MISILLASVLTLSPVELRDDLAVLRYTFEHSHGTLYRYTPKEQMDAAFDAVAAQLDHPMTELQFMRVLLPLIDSIHDAHTSVNASDAGRKIVDDAKFFPLDLRFIDGHALVEKNLSTNKRIEPRTEVVAINGMPMTEIMERAFAARPADGAIRSAKIESANFYFWLYYYLMIDDTSRFDVDVRDGDVVKRFTVDGVSAVIAQLGQYRTQTHRDFALEYVDDGRVALMTIPSFDPLSLADRFDAAFREINQKKIRTLIIDIRDNSGGWDELNTELLRHFVKRPFRVYRRFTFCAKDWEDLKYVKIDPSDFFNEPELSKWSDAQKADYVKHHTLAEVLEHNGRSNPAAGLHEPKTDSFFDGDVYLLFNGRSASSGAEVPAFVHNIGGVTLIGEEPNGAYQGVSGGVIPTFPLPHSGIRVRYPLVGYENNVMPGVRLARGAAPQFEVVETLDDAIDGCDTAMRFTLDLITSRRLHEDRR